MKNYSRVVVPALAICAFMAACTPAPPVADPGYAAEIQAQRDQREEKLRAPDGWLSLVGLDWLQDGDNHIGADPNAEIFLDAPGVPENAGTITLDQGIATLVIADGSNLKVNGEIVSEPRVLLSDGDEGGPDVLNIEQLTAYLIKRGDRIAVRIKNPEAPTRANFPGIQYFPLNPSMKIQARLEAYPQPQEVTIATAVGTEDHLLCPGILHFTIDGHDLTLQPWINTPEQRELFIVFTDGTSGRLTYGAGRFLSADLQDDGTATLDFNLAINPPCAFTPFATCPLAPPENALTVDILAGEQLEGH